MLKYSKILPCYVGGRRKPRNRATCTIGQLRQGFLFSFLKKQVMVKFTKNSLVITIPTDDSFEEYQGLQLALSEVIGFCMYSECIDNQKEFQYFLHIQNIMESMASFDHTQHKLLANCLKESFAG